MKLESNFTLPFYPHNLNRRYGIIFRVKQNGQEQKIHYEVEVICGGYISNGDFRFQISKRQVFINNKAPELLLDIMADRCGKIIYPLKILVGKQGNFKDIVNGAEIRERWEHLRPELAQYYTGNIADGMLRGMDAALVSDLKLSNIIEQDWLFKMLFPPLSGAYQNHKTTADINLPVIPYKLPLKYTLQLCADAVYTESGLIRIEAEGRCTDDRSLQEVLQGSPVALQHNDEAAKGKSEGKLSITYKVYPHNGTLYSATGGCSIQLNSGIKKIIEMEMYQLGKRDVIPISNSKTSIILEEVPVTKKKRWFS